MSPRALPGSPTDYAALVGRFPTLPKDRLPPILYRVHQLGNEPEWFGVSGNCRWDPPVEVPGGQCIADMTSPKIIGEWGLDRRISTGDDYSVCQAWASALRLAGFQLGDPATLVGPPVGPHAKRPLSSGHRREPLQLMTALGPSVAARPMARVPAPSRRPPVEVGKRLPVAARAWPGP